MNRLSIPGCVPPSALPFDASEGDAGARRHSAANRPQAPATNDAARTLRASPLPVRKERGQISIAHFADCGPQDKAAVKCTDYARRAAALLVGDDGRLNLSRVADLAAGLEQMQSLPAHYRDHLRRMLTALAQDAELVAVIQGICEQPAKAPTGPAAEAVKATLNLPLQEARVDKTQARKAAVMALLGNLRQREVGSCFSTGPAICLLDDSPVTVARDLKSLLEENKLTLTKDGHVYEIPLRRHGNRSAAAVTLAVGADGRCFGPVVGESIHDPGIPITSAPCKLHEMPGMQGALTALGIAPTRWDDTIRAALRDLGVQGNELYEATCEQVIAQLARNLGGPSDPARAAAFALDAFAAKEDVRLLQAWEYTLAALAECDQVTGHVAVVCRSVLFGDGIPHRPELQSLGAKAAEIRETLEHDEHFAAVDVASIVMNLMIGMQNLVQKRLGVQFDPDLAHAGNAGDGVSVRGGFVLHERLQDGGALQLRRIDTPAAFQAAMVLLTEDASRMLAASLRDQAGLDALRWMTDQLVEYIMSDDFPSYVALDMNADALREQRPDCLVPVDFDRCANLPWKNTSGADPAAVMRRYGGTVAHRMHFGAPSSPAALARMERGDASHLIEFFCAGLSRMAPALRERSRETHADFKVPIQNQTHAFSLMPARLDSVWLTGRQSAQQWIEHHLKQPALRHLHQRRTDPALIQLLRAALGGMGATPQQVGGLYRAITRDAGSFHHGKQAYTLERAHDALRGFCRERPDGDAMLAHAETALAAMAAFPGRVLADTNWTDGKGNAAFLAAAYNPWRDLVELYFTNQADGDRSPVSAHWLAGEWIMWTPIGGKPVQA